MLLLEKLLPFLFIGCIGFYCARKSLLKEPILAPINNVIFYIGLPAMLFKGIAGQQATSALPVFPALTVALPIPASFLIATCTSRFLYRPSASPARATWIQTSTHCNHALAFPLIFYLLGDAGILVAGLVSTSLIITQNIASIFTYQRMCLSSKKENPASALKALLTNPTILATGSATVWHQCALPIPEIFSQTLGLLAGLFLPLALLTIGARLAFWKCAPSKKNIRELILLYCHKIILLPVIGLGIGSVFGLSPLENTVLIITLAAPTALVSSIYATEMGGNPQHAATIIGLTHSLCPISYLIWLTLAGI